MCIKLFQVYKITNLITNKCYIGSSENYQNRWNQHKKNAFNPNHKSYKYHLQSSIRKYGIENYKYEVLREDFLTRYEAEEYEQQMIDFYDSYYNGYNNTRETHNALTDENIRAESIKKRSQPCAWVDIDQNIIEKYSSYQEAGRKQGYENRASAIRDVCKGKESSVNGKIFRDINEEGQVVKLKTSPYKNRKSIVCIPLDNPNEKIYFHSISEAANILKADRQSIRKCISGNQRYSSVKGYIIREIDFNGEIIENNILIQDKLKEYNEKNPVINGERHNITEWCNIFKITKNCFYYRLKKGMGVVEALTTPKGR